MRRANEPDKALQERSAHDGYAARMAECEGRGHVTTPWLLRGFRRYLCIWCGRTWAERPQERQS